MTNCELYMLLREKIGNTGIVYFRESTGTYSSSTLRDVYTPCRIMEYRLNDKGNRLEVKLLRFKTVGFNNYMPPINVSVADVYFPAPINSNFHGDMVPIATYFELEEDHDRYVSGLRHQLAVKTLAANSVYGLAAYNRYGTRAEQFEYDKIIFSGPCTIIIWKDGTKTMARVSEGDTFDPEKGVAICFMKRLLGHTETNKILKIADEMWELKNTAFADDEKVNIIEQIKEMVSANTCVPKSILEKGENDGNKTYSC